MDYGFYIASVFGALAVWLMLPSDRRRPAMLGALIGAGSLGALLILAANSLPEGQSGRVPGLYYYAFSVLGIAAAVRVITHARPVYSALYFVMVVLSVAGLFLTLEAEFMAFAMVIIYAGAILVTYLFVIMLATLPQSSHETEAAPDYDRLAREPFLACVVGFGLLAVLTHVLFTGPADPITRRPGDDVVYTAVNTLPSRLTPALAECGALDIDPTLNIKYSIGSDGIVADAGIGGTQTIPITDEVRAAIGDAIGNIDRVGINLFKAHPLGIELAGVILLLSMVGAVVIAKKRVPSPTPNPQTPAPNA